jgi:type IX secretion system PorP/SprF family membrane protein
MFVVELYAQDVEFSQFYANKLYMNPAFAGSIYDSRLALNYRNQWPEVRSAYETYAVSYDFYSYLLSGGLGVSVLQDSQGGGILKTTSMSGIYCHTFNFRKGLMVKGALQMGFTERHLDWTSFVYPDQIDDFHLTGIPSQFTNETVPDNNKNGFFDLSSGVLIGYKEMFLGFAAHHLLEPDETFKDESDYSKLPRKYTIHFGMEIPLSIRGLHREVYRLSPNVVMRHQGSNKQINYGLYAIYNKLILGMWYRDNFELEYDAVILQIGYKYQNWQLSYSYDKTISKLVHTNAGAHEISVNLKINNHYHKKYKCIERYYRKKHRVGRISCPAF